MRPARRPASIASQLRDGRVTPVIQAIMLMSLMPQTNGGPPWRSATATPSILAEDAGVRRSAPRLLRRATLLRGMPCLMLSARRLARRCVLTEAWKFRNGTLDQAIFNEVVDDNEYRLPDRFAPGDVVIDVGTHIGSFVQAVLSRGCGKRLLHRTGRCEFRDRGGKPAAPYRQWGRAACQGRGMAVRPQHRRAVL